MPATLLGWGQDENLFLLPGSIFSLDWDKTSLAACCLWHPQQWAAIDKLCKVVPTAVTSGVIVSMSLQGLSCSEQHMKISRGKRHDVNGWKWFPRTDQPTDIYIPFWHKIIDVRVGLTMSSKKYYRDSTTQIISWLWKVLQTHSSVSLLDKDKSSFLHGSALLSIWE